MNRKFLFLLIIYFVTSFNVSAQNKFTIQIAGGLSYIPMQGIAHNYIACNTFEAENICPGYEASARYYITANDVFYFSVADQKTEAEISCGQEDVIIIKTKYEIIPFTIGYEHFFSTKSKLKPYLGIGAAFVKTWSESFCDWGDMEYSENTYGFECKFGVKYKMFERVNFRSEVEYRYHADVKASNHNNAYENNLSGIGLYLGAEIGLF